MCDPTCCPCDWLAVPCYTLCWKPLEHCVFRRLSLCSLHPDGLFRGIFCSLLLSCCQIFSFLNAAKKICDVGLTNIWLRAHLGSFEKQIMIIKTLVREGKIQRMKRCSVHVHVGFLLEDVNRRWEMSAWLIASPCAWSCSLVSDFLW